MAAIAGLGRPWPALVGAPRKGGKPFPEERRGGKTKEEEMEKPQDGRRKSGQNIGNPYQMEDNKAAPSAPPKGAALRAAPLGVLLSSIW